MGNYPVGVGFVLGNQTVITLDSPDKLKVFLDAFASRVMIEGEHVLPITLKDYENFEAELADSMEH